MRNNNQEKPKPGYYSVMPASVRYDIDLIPNAKILYSEITSLSNQKGYCWASNGYFAELYSVSTRQISNWISQLEKKGHIKTVLIREVGKKAIKERHIYLKEVIPSLEKKEKSDKNLLQNRQEWENPDRENVSANLTRLLAAAKSGKIPKNL